MGPRRTRARVLAMAPVDRVARTRAAVAFAVALLGALLLSTLATTGAPRVRAAEPLSVTTPYPAVAAEPGDDLTFPINVATDQRRTVQLALSGVPQGWEARLRGGGFTLDGVTAEPTAPPQVELAVTVPEAVTGGSFTITVEATSGTLTASLPVTIRIAAETGGDATFDPPEVTTKEGPPGETYTFTLTLRNDTARELQFALEGLGPQGWQVRARPSGEDQATGVTVDAGSSETITVTAVSPPRAEAGTYPMQVVATAGDVRVESARFGVVITGTPELQLVMPEGQTLNLSANAGAAKQFQMFVRNSGTAPLQNVRLESRPPADWQVTFEPETVPQVAPGEAEAVNVTLTPSGNAIAGDYQLDMDATTEQTEASLALRVTIETSLSWALVGAGLMVLALAALWWVFRTFGRR
jgi:uncharacterized membrane protein